MGKPSTKSKDQQKESKPTLSQLALLSERTKKLDPTATPADLIKDLRRVQEMYPDKFITRRYYRAYGKYSDGTWDRHFGTMEEFRGAAGLQLNRHQRRLERDIAKHNALDIFSDFYEQQIAPWAGKYEKKFSNGRVKTLVIGSDFHDEESDPFVLSVFLDTCKRVQPDIIVLNGDIFDLFEFSRYDKDPRKVRLKARFEFVRDRIFKPLRRVCPKAQIDLIVGNHEMRLLKHLASATPHMFALHELHGITFAKLLMLDQHEINLVAKLDMSAYQPKEVREELKRNYKKYFDTIVVNHEGDEDYGMNSISGHTHRPKMLSKANEVMGPIWNLTTGSICKIDADYHGSKVNAQQSFAVIHVDTKHRQAVPEHIMFSDHMAVVGGQYYFRN
jgi:UDP-2,3-diacylglucosamine pyrophosphatase LpxH